MAATGNGSHTGCAVRLGSWKRFTDIRVKSDQLNITMSDLMKDTFGHRLTTFLLFVILTVITVGLYPLYFWITQTKEQTLLLKEIRDKMAK
jgi:hypothetical protein